MKEFSSDYQPEHDRAKPPRHRGQVTRALIKALHEPTEGGKKLDRVAAALVDKAMAGDVSAIQEVMNRVDGKVAQRYEGKTEHQLTAGGAFARLLEQMNKRELPSPVIDVTPANE